MQQLFRLLIPTALVLLASACGGRTGSAATMPDGSQIAIMVHFDEGISDDMKEDRKTQLHQLGTWMKEDLVAILTKTGYSAVMVAEPEQSQPGAGRYALNVKITNYNAGSKAARMFIGYGAGSATLDTHFELLGADGNALVTGDPSVGSGRDWTNAARKVNLLTVDPVNAKLNSLH